MKSEDEDHLSKSDEDKDLVFQKFKEFYGMKNKLQNSTRKVKKDQISFRLTSHVKKIQIKLECPQNQRKSRR